jgi:hypothetical protein
MAKNKKTPQQLVYRSFPIKNLEGLYSGAISADALVNRIHATMGEARPQGFDDFYIEVETETDYDGGCDGVLLSLRGSRPETQEEQRAKEVKEADYRAEIEKRCREQEAKSNQVARALAKGAVRGLTQEEVLALWREAQEDK